MTQSTNLATAYALAVDETLTLVGSGPGGLTEVEARLRLDRCGPNRLPDGSRKTLPAIVLHQFQSAFIYLLAAAAGLSIFLTHYVDAGFIILVLLSNAAIGGYQEWRAEGRAQALRALVRGSVPVFRDGHLRKVDIETLVPGDVLELESGARVPADLRLISSETLEVDESLLTGEAYPVLKAAEVTIPEGAPLGDRRTALYAGTLVRSGRTRAVVTATALDTEVGRLAAAMRQTVAPPPLIRRMERFTRQIALAAVVLIGAILLIEIQRGAPVAQVLLLAIALAVSAIPEGLPVAMTVALSISVRRMALRNVIVRHLPAVEGLGACTLIATDKTGTLTLNRLSVEAVWTPDCGRIGTMDRRARDLALAAARCSESHAAGTVDHRGEEIGDAVDLAFLRMAARFDYNVALESASHHSRIAYEPERRYAAEFHTDGDALFAYVKGAPETVLALCGEEDWAAADREAAADAIQALAAEGYRVLAVAAGPVTEPEAESLDGLQLLGFAGLIDPLREEALPAIHAAQSAGIRVVMVTGDHPVTALAIARQLELAASLDDVVTGVQLKAVAHDPTAFDALVLNATVFARTEPLQKLEIVQSFKRQGHVVAVTGDGVNDAAALKAADIGVAMGRGGTDIAREAADLILVDDNFASIVAGIEEGRAAYDNLRKVILLCISTGAAEILLMLLATLAGLPPPLNAVQLLWLNLVTNGIQDVALAFEKGEPNLLNRRPRPKYTPILDRRMIEQIAVSSAVIGLVAFGVYFYVLEVLQYGLVMAQGIILWLMVWFENVHTANCRSETRSVLEVPLSSNLLLVIGVVAAQGLQFLVYAVPGAGALLGIDGVEPAVAAMLALPALVLLLVMEVYKALRKKFWLGEGGLTATARSLR